VRQVGYYQEFVTRYTVNKIFKKINKFHLLYNSLHGVLNDAVSPADVM